MLMPVCLTCLILAGPKSDKPGFIGAPYEFWVGANVGIGTSVGQIRINDAMEKNDVSYDLLHSYEEGGKCYLNLNINLLKTTSSLLVCT